jgi:hypothetical protein
VASTAFFARGDVAAFLAAVDASGGFFTHGWGDSLVQALAVKMFAPPSAVAQVCERGGEFSVKGTLRAGAVARGCGPVFVCCSFGVSLNPVRAGVGRGLPPRVPR